MHGSGRMRHELEHQEIRHYYNSEGRQKKAMFLSPASYITPGGPIEPMDMKDHQRYLGLHYDWKGTVTPKRTLELERMLAEIKAAPLKPQPRLMIVREFLFPRLIHELVLGQAHRNTLKKMDTMIRGAVREWLRLPKDTSLGLFHAPFSHGDLVLGPQSPSLRRNDSQSSWMERTD